MCLAAMRIYSYARPDTMGSSRRRVRRRQCRAGAQQAEKQDGVSTSVSIKEVPRMDKRLAHVAGSVSRRLRGIDGLMFKPR